MIDFPLAPTPGVTTVTEGRKSWLCIGLDANGKGIYDLISTPDAMADAAAASEAAAALAVAQAQFADYTALRGYIGSGEVAYITGYLVTAAPAGVAGLFTRDDADTTSADNGGTVIVAANGKRWKRVFSGAVNPEWFGADPLGVSDSASAIQAAVDSLVSTGGEVSLSRRYRVNSQITVSSTKPIHLTGPGKGMLYDPSLAVAGLVIGASIAGSMVKYVSPGVRSTAGGGCVKGINFYDDTGVSGTPGTRTCTAALELYDFPLSRVEGCSFHWINGSAILGEFCVMSDIQNNVIRYCGAAGKPALYLPSTEVTLPAQQMEISGNKIEVCHGAAYVSLGANSADCKLNANGFEADEATAASNQVFLAALGHRHAINGNHFNRNTGIQVTLGGQDSAFTGNQLAGGAYATTAVVLSGYGWSYAGNQHSSGRTGLELDVTGGSNAITGNSLYFSGAVRIGRTGNVFSGNSLRFCTATTANLGAGDDFWIIENDDGLSGLNVITDNTLNNNGGTITTTGGIRMAGTRSLCDGNSFTAFNGSGNGAVCIRNDSQNSRIGENNTQANCTTMLVHAQLGNRVNALDAENTTYGLEEKLPGGLHTILDTVFVLDAGNRMNLHGHGKWATTLEFNIGAGATAITVNNPHVGGYNQGRVAHLGFSSANALDKTFLDLVNVANFIVESIATNSGSWPGDSIGVRARGRQLVIIRDSELGCARPIVLSPNATWPSLATDHFLIENCELLGSSATRDVIQAEDGVCFGNTTIRHCAIVGGRHGIYWNDTTSAAASYSLLIDEIRVEQAIDQVALGQPIAYGVYLASTAQALQSVKISNSYLGSAVGELRNGIYLRNAQSIVIDNVTFSGGAGTTALDVTLVAGSRMSIRNFHVQTGAAITITNGRCIKKEISEGGAGLIHNEEWVFDDGPEEGQVRSDSYHSGVPFTLAAGATKVIAGGTFKGFALVECTSNVSGMFNLKGSSNVVFEVSDPDAWFGITSGAGDNILVYHDGTNYVLKNNTAGELTFAVELLGGTLT